MSANATRREQKLTIPVVAKDEIKMEDVAECIVVTMVGSRECER